MSSGRWDIQEGLGAGSRGNGTLEISGGTVTSAYGYIGTAATGTGSVLVSSGTWANNRELGVGYEGNGTLEISGGTVTSAYGSIGTATTGSGNVTVSSGTWDSGSDLYVGNQGNGNLEISGGTVINTNGYIGYNEGATGSAIVSSGTWATGNQLHVGYSGNGTLEISGGTVTSTNAYIGSFGSGSVTVSSGTFDSGSDLYVGNEGNGNLEISGGTVINTNGRIGYNEGATGSAIVSSGTWANGNELHVGYSGDGTLEISGGTVTSTNAYIGTFGSGSVTVSSGTWANGNQLHVGYSGNGTLEISGGTVTSAYGYIGFNTVGTGRVIVSGGTWDNNSELNVGSYGNGTLEISGGTVISAYGYIGNATTGTGSVIVSSGTWDNNSDLYVGSFGNGKLELTGGIVTIGGGTGRVRLGLYEGSGTLNVGMGSEAGVLEAAAVIGGQGSATVNFNHTGTYEFRSMLGGNLNLNKLGSGTTTLSGDNFYAGDTTVKEGGLVISGVTLSIGTGSIDGMSASARVTGTWDNTGDLYIGGTGTGALTVDGGTLNNADGYIGFHSVSNGNVTVGSGTWYNSGNLFVGLIGSGALNITGGAVSNSNGFIGAYEDGRGSVTVSSGTWDNSADVYVGWFGTGSLNISGGTVENARGFIGYTNGGSVTVSGGTWDNSGDLIVGNDGTGTLNISGGTVRNSTGSIGYGYNASGSVTVSSGTWDNSEDLQIGIVGTGTLNISGGTVSSSNAYIGTLSSYGRGSVTVSSGSWSNSNSLVVGDYNVGALTISGGLVSSGSGVIGSRVGSNGTARITGGTWSNSSDLFVGASGTGSLNISGGTVSSRTGYIGNMVRGRGSVTVSSGTWANSDSLVVGNSGVGVMTVNGGLVSAGAGVIGSGTGSSGTVAITGGIWSNVGELYVGKSGTGTLSLSGSGALIIGSGTGKLTLAERAGSVGTLNLGAGNGVGRLDVGEITSGSGSATVNLNHSGTYSLASVLSGSLGVNKRGSGTTLLTGSNSFTGMTRIEDGGFVVNGSLAGSVTVMGGFLGGSGVIGGNVVNNAVVSPGNSPGTLTVNGNYTQGSTGTLRMEVAGTQSGQFDRLVVLGNIQLGGTLAFSSVGGFRLKVGDQLNVISAANVSGSFSQVVTDTILTGSVSFSPSGVGFGIAPEEGVVEIVQGSFREFAMRKGLSPNRKSVATALDSAVGKPGSGKMINYLNARLLGELPGDFDKIAPEELTSIFNLGISQAQTQSLNLQRRTEELRAGVTGFSSAGLSITQRDGKQAVGEGKSLIEEPTNDWRRGVFITGVGELIDVGASSNASGFDLSTAGVNAGLDYRFGPGFAAGVSTGYAKSDADLADGGDLSVNGGKLGLYATVFENGWYVDSAVTGGYNSYETKRSSLDGYARGKTDGAELNALLSSGYRWQLGGVSFGPTAGVNYTSLWMDGFEEKGSLSALKIENRRAESIRGSLGAQASYDWKVGRMALRPQVRSSWEHEFGDRVYDLSSSFASGAGDSFRVSGPSIGRDSFRYGVGCALECSQRVSSYLYYDGELSSEASSHTLSLGMRVGF